MKLGAMDRRSRRRTCAGRAVAFGRPAGSRRAVRDRRSLPWAGSPGVIAAWTGAEAGGAWRAAIFRRLVCHGRNSFHPRVVQFKRIAARRPPVPDWLANPRRRTPISRIAARLVLYHGHATGTTPASNERRNDGSRCPRRSGGRPTAGRTRRAGPRAPRRRRRPDLAPRRGGPVVSPLDPEWKGGTVAGPAWR